MREKKVSSSLTGKWDGNDVPMEQLSEKRSLVILFSRKMRAVYSSPVEKQETGIPSMVAAFIGGGEDAGKMNGMKMAENYSVSKGMNIHREHLLLHGMALGASLMK